MGADRIALGFIRACGAAGISPEEDDFPRVDPKALIDLDRLLKFFQAAYAAGKRDGMKDGRREAELVAKASSDLKAVRQRKGV